MRHRVGVPSLCAIVFVSQGCVLNLTPVEEESTDEGRPNAFETGVGEGDSSTDGDAGDGDAGDGDGDGDGDSGVDPWWCESTEECGEGRFCWANYDGGNGDAPAMEEFGCYDQCVPDDDPESMTDPAESFWCIDDASCCSPNATCGAMGYCSPP